VRGGKKGGWGRQVDGDEKGRGSGEEGEAGGGGRLERERERELDSRHTISASLFQPLHSCLCMNNNEYTWEIIVSV
jgi:hypothetical protein